MSDNKNKVIGVRFDDSTLKRLKILAEASHDSVSGIVRRATMYCLPAFEGGPFPVPQEQAAPAEAAPENVQETKPDTGQVDIMDVIISGGSDAADARNESEGEG